MNILLVEIENDLEYVLTHLNFPVDSDLKIAFILDLSSL